MARGVVGSVIGYVRAHPYLTAGVAVATAEVMRSRDCPRSVSSTLASLVALAATANAGVAAVGAGLNAVRGNPSGVDIFANPADRRARIRARYRRGEGPAIRFHAPARLPGQSAAAHRVAVANARLAAARRAFVNAPSDVSLDFENEVTIAREELAAAHRAAGTRGNPSAPEPRSRYSPEGRLTALPVVKVSGLKAGTVVLGKKGKPAVIGAKGPKLAKDQVLVLGRWDRPQVITRSCGNSSGGPGTVLATGKSRKGCSRADAARVMGIKSWRDSLANTTLRQAAALNALKAAFKKRGIRPPAEFKTAAAQANDAARTLVKSNLAVMTQRRAAR